MYVCHRRHRRRRRKPPVAATKCKVRHRKSLQKIGGGNQLNTDGWGAARRWAARRDAGCAPLFSCHPDKRPGGIAGDNCFWSAPPSALSRSLHALSDTYAALAADDARVTSCRRVRHPETLLACAMASADVCGRNLSAARAL